MSILCYDPTCRIFTFNLDLACWSGVSCRTGICHLDRITILLLCCEICYSKPASHIIMKHPQDPENELQFAHYITETCDAWLQVSYILVHTKILCYATTQPRFWWVLSSCLGISAYRKYHLTSPQLKSPTLQTAIVHFYVEAPYI
jgi:hypothetical protein